MSVVNLPVTESMRRIAHGFLGFNPWSQPSGFWTSTNPLGKVTDQVPLGLGAGFMIGKLRLGELLAGKPLDPSTDLSLSEFIYGEGSHSILYINGEQFSFGDMDYRRRLVEDGWENGATLPPLVEGVNGLVDEAEVLFEALRQIDPELRS